MSRYVIAVKRQCRDAVAANWPENLANVGGVSVVGHTGHIAQVDATPEGISRVKDILGDQFNVEQTIPHLKQTS